MALGEGGGCHAVWRRVWYLVHHYGRRWVWSSAVCLVLSGLGLLDLYCSGSHAHADRDSVQVRRVEIIVVVNIPSSLFFSWPANSMARPGCKQATSTPLKKGNGSHETTTKSERCIMYMLQGRAGVRSDLASSTREKGSLIDFPILPKSYVPPRAPSTHASSKS